MALSAEPLLQRQDIKTLVVFRALRVGDMLCAIPALRALRKAVPDARITLAGLPWAEQIARRFSGYINEFIAFPGHPALPEQVVLEAELPLFYEHMRSRRFDLALQMHGSGQVSNGIVGKFGARMSAGFHAGDPPLHGSFMPYPESGLEIRRLNQLVEYLGAQPAGDHLEFPLDDEDRRELASCGIAAGLTPGEYICIHPGASSITKCWSLERFAEIGDRLALEYQLPIVLTGSGNEAELVSSVTKQMKTKAINAALPLSIGAMAVLLSRARLLVCNDTGVSHIAAALKLPSVVIFNTADIRRWAPIDQQLHRCIQDPQGVRADDVLREARRLLDAAA
jgi:ADP-heptose:LPS heptosyltransferase